jgi:hypothetical protein
LDFSKRSYAVFGVPPLSEEAMKEFNTLAFDPYTGGRQRYRRFSQMKLQYVNGEWVTELLPPRPFVQSKGYNGVVGGVARKFEPIRFDPTPQVAAGARAAGLDTGRVYQINVHQVRVITDKDITGVTVPEGPHRDGHDYVMNIIFKRHGISGGISQLMPTGGGDPFFEDLLNENQAIIFDDRKMWHNATNIMPLGDEPGHRDIMIISFNDWERRRYGEEFERNGGALQIDTLVQA